MQQRMAAKQRNLTKQRLDLLLLERGLVESREQGRRLIMAGEVRVNDIVIDKPGFVAPVDGTIELQAAPLYVSRGGLKLAAALAAFDLDVKGLLAVDVGASTGGFSDCLLQHEVGRVYAIDVGYGQLAWKVRTDPRVITVERTNIRYLEQLPDGVLADLAVIDASFISLRLVLPATLRLLKPAAQLIALIKPQFEAGRTQVGKGGVVRDAKVHRQVIEEVIESCIQLGLHCAGIIPSPAPGPAGNIEFLLWLQTQAYPAMTLSSPTLTQQIDQAMQMAAILRVK
jgi:23S rRNA (cytidine1920-2'-O)/16S rRNA (cytidine1409-2'-O)-methyltransferase